MLRTILFLLTSISLVAAAETSLPLPVQHFQTRWYPESLKTIETIKIDDPSFHDPQFTLLSYEHVSYVPFQNAWLVGVRLGVLGGNAGITEDRFFLIDECGEVLVALEPHYNVDSCQLVEIKKGLLCVVFASAPTRPDYLGCLTVSPLGEETHPIFEFTCPSAEAIENTLYFCDLNHDGVREILIESTTKVPGRKPQASAPTRFALYGHRFYPQQSNSLLSDALQARNDPSSVKAFVWGPPYEDDSDTATP